MSEPSPRLLSGGNPQIPKGDGDAPVQAWIAAVPGWKQPLARDIDRLVAEAAPDAARAVRWNSPFYGVAPGQWFMNLHCITGYIKVAFFQGADLTPPPPVASKHPGVRYLHVTEAGLDVAQLRDWIAQAARLSGVRM